MFKVKWEIEIDAKDPGDAARRALEIHRDPSSLATWFDVSAIPADDTRYLREDVTMIHHIDACPEGGI
jgi:hypothetical protein